MKINRGYRFKLDPTAAQTAALEQHARVCRMVYNLAVEQRRDHHRQFRRATGKHISYTSQAAELTELRAEFDWIRAVTQTCQQQALRDVDRAYQNFFSGIADYPSFRKKGINESFRFQGREVTFRRLNRSWGMVKLPKIGEVRFRWNRDIPGKLKNVTISLDPLGWHVSFATEQEVEVLPNHRPSIGGDRGVNEPIAYSDGTFAVFPKERLAVLEKKARRAAQALAKGKKGSNRRKVAKARVAALRAKMARIRKHFNHVETARLARTYGIVCLEDLKIRNMTASASGTVEEPGVNVAQKRELNRSILEIGWYQFHQFLAYKLAAAGGEVRLVRAAYTSTTCSCCGMNEKTNRKSQAVYECAGCGSAMNADTNAAINILMAGTRPTQVRRVAAKRKSHLEAKVLAA
jgi:putative transposase